MDIMDKMDLDNQMTVLEGALMEEEAQNINDEVEDLSNSLREVVQDEAVKPKLHCLMMDQAFSMVTLQSEDSGIHWETVSSRCSTPWASEVGSTAPEVCNNLVPKCTTSGAETAGNIIFIMDDDQVIRKKKEKPNKKAEFKKSDKEPVEPDRPAMVEVSIPNVMTEKDSTVEDPKEDKNQQLFCLVSEGSEILNIVVPPKVSTVDEEESQGLVDNLSYLEETPVIKAYEFIDETEASWETQTGNLADLQVTIQAVPEQSDVLPSIKPALREPTNDDYFEKFTLLDQQAPAPAEVSTTEAELETGTTSRQDETETKDTNTDAKLLQEVTYDSGSISELEITSEHEHVDEIFYGGRSDIDNQPPTRTGANKDNLPKHALKKSGSALFDSQESVLTPVFLPEGPKKIIDLILLEEPKAMAFMYSDLYADSVGSRQKQDDTESMTSEKSFHSQESDNEDRGYLEKFVLKDETPVTTVDALPDDHQGDRVSMWSQDAFGLTIRQKDATGAPEDVNEITDFFRDSASSPCDHVGFYKVEPEKTKPTSKNRHVVFQDEAMKDVRRTAEVGNIPQQLESDSSVGTSFETTDYKSVIDEFAAKMVAPRPSKPDKTVRGQSPNLNHVPIIVPQNVKPITPQHKPFLDLTPLLPVETLEEEEGDRKTDTKEVGDNKSPNHVCASIAKEEEATVETLDSEKLAKQEASEEVMPAQQCSTTTQVTSNPVLNPIHDTVQADHETREDIHASMS
ncbi:cardiomyopathy-associated protein 5 [Trichomycterus rosablanca]|uniref:cardiomyopathy-associated protein 5 n=1 Tax=Trichomycterus rosablanca TaxID=2290929 RepID=UPI002F354245